MGNPLDDLDQMNPDSMMDDPRAASCAPAASAVMDRAARRADLRQRVSESLGQALSGKDLAILCAIGAVGAIPATDIDDNVLGGLQHVLGEPAATKLTSIVSPQQLRQALLDALSRGTISIDPAAIHALLAGSSSGSARLIADAIGQGGGMATSASTASAFVVPDGEDALGAGLTKLLTDAFCKHRGWATGTAPFHQAKAVAYTVSSTVSLPFNPNPALVAMGAWHLYKAMCLSRQLSGDVIELARLAVADGKAIGDDYDAAVGASSSVDALVAGVLGGPLSEGRATAPTSMTDPKRRNRWSQ